MRAATNPLNQIIDRVRLGGSGGKFYDSGLVCARLRCYRRIESISMYRDQES